MTTLMIMLGISPQNIIMVAPFEAVMAFFVHSNLKFTLGPLRYIIASPVFHRWHHVKENPGLACNYGAIFSLWDVAFATFYLPRERLPENYGVEHSPVPETFVSQLLFPFLAVWSTPAVLAKPNEPTTGPMVSPELTNRG
jgi:sterol desaturase/sphingolipid hydroxylase (fatty acid hydroxylase superfamily)